MEEAEVILGRRLECRAADFLALVRQTISPYPQNPYRQLLGLAGIEYGDLEKLVTQDGVEGALHTLFRHGVYLAVDEFKGRRPVVRGSATIMPDPTQVRNPALAFHIPTRSSGSRGDGTLVPTDIASVRDHAVSEFLALQARGATGWHHAIWEVPGGAAVRVLLRYAAAGRSPLRWFSQVDPASPGLHPRYRWSARVMRWGGLLAGVSLPYPRYVSLEDPLPIAHWMAQTLRRGETPHLNTFASSAVRLCRAASAAGIDLVGAQFTLVGEPLTAARLAVVRQAGGIGVPAYAAMEAGGRIGYGCLAPNGPDDFHLFHDLHAVIQPGSDGEGRGVGARTLLLSSLRLTTPIVLLNVSLGDQAIMVDRACGCPLAKLGWTTHLHTVRSFEKLTAGGMTFLDADVIRVLEDVLPARFGGAPTHYQLVEEETNDGTARLRLFVHPAVGPLDPRQVAEAFLRAIGPGSGAQRVMALFWENTNVLRVERRPPLATASGKILHLHVAPKIAHATREASAR